MRFKKLTIVSDTPLCYYNDNWYGFNAVVKEIECIEEMFDEIVWLGAISNDLKGSPILIKINVEKVKIVPLKLIGGKTIFSKLKISCTMQLPFHKTMLRPVTLLIYAPIKKPKSSVNKMPPNVPSQVFLGEMRSKSLRFPIARPVK